FISALCYKFKLEGKRTIAYFIKFIAPLVLLVTAFNMFFTHYGVTVLFTAFDMNFTFEGLFYGFCQGIMISSLIMWFSCYSRVVTSERFLAVFGKFAPNSALVFSMVLSFIPRLRKNASEINDARLLLDDEKSKLKRSIKNFSALLSLTLEQSIEVSDSMKARGFGRGRTSYSKFSFFIADGVCIAAEFIAFAVLCVMRALGKMTFIFEPVIRMDNISVMSIVLFTIFSILPLIVDLTEDMRWFYLKQKI
ncbi:MAG: energy-coupling factor transporter transmembrane protein EcfT, partial [Eubacterium sp.]|nr:energy-coupling factor transporter transmembrane protein EcfT [Eubacterium sp.]